MASYAVVWDGRKNGPGGAQLFVDEPPRVPAPVTKRPPARRYLLLPSERREIARDCEVMPYKAVAEKWDLSVSAVNSIAWREKQAGL